jgi:dihydropyrimidine dehydrogenase (NAD+) subunit PreA
VPWIDEPECVGCNLCALVCPVEGCITMVEQPHPAGVDTWNDRIATGRDKVHGGIYD